MKVKEYVEIHQGLWNLLGNITYEIDEFNKCVNTMRSFFLILTQYIRLHKSETIHSHLHFLIEFEVFQFHQNL